MQKPLEFSILTMMSVKPYKLDPELDVTLPVYASRISAGFPSPADDFLEGSLDLNAHLIQNKAATFIVRASGESMIGAGIYPNDLLLVDRSITPKSGHVVIACVQGELLVKRLYKSKNRIELRAENKDFKAIVINDSDEFFVWGVVTSVIHSLK